MVVEKHFGIASEWRDDIPGGLGKAIRFPDYDDSYCQKCGELMFTDALGYICGKCGRKE